MSFFNKKRNKDEDSFELIELYGEDEKKEKISSPDMLTPEEIADFGNTQNIISNNSALDSLKKKVEKAPDTKEETASLLDKCMPYIVDENGVDKSEDKEPLYKLQSVAEILKNQSEKTLEKLSKQYGLAFEEMDLKKNAQKPKKETNPEPQPLSEKPIIKEPKETFSNIQSNIPIIISDIDDTTDKSVTEKTDIENTATVTFTPVISADSITSEIQISTQTKPIDLTNELVKLPKNVEEKETSENKLESDDFDEYVPSFEIRSEKDAIKYKKELFFKKRNAFLITFFSFFITAILGIAKLPLFSELIISYTKVSMTVFSSLTFITVIINSMMFKSLIRVFKKKYSPDMCASLATVFTAVYAIIGIIKGEIILDMLLTLCLILSFRALRKFLKHSYMLSNLNIAFSGKDKNAVKLISDPAITYSMVKNSIEGDVLVAAPKRTEGIANFIKYSNYGKFLNGKYPIVVLLSLVMSLISGLSSAVLFDGIIYGFYTAAAIECIFALPFSFFIDILPLYSTAKALKKHNAAILGKAGAKQTELVNAMVINSSDIFPTGTVTLHQMKVLSENELDDTLIRAAALSEYMKSPLAPLFKGIVNTGDIDILPNTDTVKYEDPLGISGWVDNRLLFIGNRTLMESHGIAVPSIETDRNILRKGFFPIYVATPENACALLVVKYSVEPKIARILRKITDLGVTLLVDNTDPNLTEEMICDYFGLYNDSVKVMSAVGSHMYNNTVTSAIIGPAPAVYKGSGLSLASILVCANKIKRSNMLLTVIYIIAAIIGASVFSYTSFGMSGNILSPIAILLYCVITTVSAYLIYLTERP